MEGNYFHTDSTKEYENSLRQAEKEEKQGKKPSKRSVVVLPSRDKFEISDKANWNIYEFTLKDQAKKYFELNGPITVNLIDKDIVDPQDGTILTQMWFRNLDNLSGFSGNYRDLYDVNRARGVLRATEGSEATQKNLRQNLPYTQRDIDRELERVRRIKEGKIRLSELGLETGKLEQFLASLKQ